MLRIVDVFATDITRELLANKLSYLHNLVLQQAVFKGVAKVQHSPVLNYYYFSWTECMFFCLFSYASIFRSCYVIRHYRNVWVMVLLANFAKDFFNQFTAES